MNVRRTSTVAISAVVIAVVAHDIGATEGPDGSTEQTTAWKDLTDAEKMCVCKYIECFPEDVQDAINALKTNGKLCKGEATERNPNPTLMARTTYDPSDGSVHGVAFTAAFFAQTDERWKKVTVRQEANRAAFGPNLPIPGAGAAAHPGDGGLCDNAVVGAYRVLNQALGAARDAASRASMHDMDPPGADDPPTVEQKAAWKKWLCENVTKGGGGAAGGGAGAAAGAIEDAENFKKRAQRNVKTLKNIDISTPPAEGAPAWQSELHKAYERVCCEIGVAKKRVAALGG